MTPEEIEARKLLIDAARSTVTPEPSLWVRIVQMAFAATAFGIALAIALVLLLQGPPAPKEPEGSAGGEDAMTAVHASATAPVRFAADEGEAESSPSEGSDSEESSEGGSEEGSSLANLNEQAPWAFAIVALLAGTFIATGKSVNFGGTKFDGGAG